MLDYSYLMIGVKLIAVQNQRCRLSVGNRVQMTYQLKLWLFSQVETTISKLPFGKGQKSISCLSPEIKCMNISQILRLCEPGSKLLVLGMAIQPLIRNPYNGYINPYYWVDDHPLLYGNNGSLDPSTCRFLLVAHTHTLNRWDVMECQVATSF